MPAGENNKGFFYLLPTYKFSNPEKKYKTNKKGDDKKTGSL
jgi:hypothetical protein